MAENLTAEVEMPYSRFDDDTASLSDHDIPMRPENRKPTDKYFLVAFFLVILLLIPFLAYTLANSDIRRLPKQVQKTYSTRRDYNPWNSEQSVAMEYKKGSDIDFSQLAWKLVFISFIALALCIAMAIMLRKATHATVWGILILSCLLFAVIAVYEWTQENETVTAIVMTILSIIIFCVLMFMKDKIQLTIMLFKEATRATFQMKMIFAIPVVIFILTLLIIFAFLSTLVTMQTAGIQTYNNQYIPTNTMIFTIFFNAFVFIWVIEFLSGIHYMSISGAVTKWYFTRNKELLGSPVYTSVYITLKYHLGTLAFGSLVISLVAILRAILKKMLGNPRIRWLVVCFIDHIENFLRFFTQNSYIVTAMHGTPFIASGKQAVKLLTLNICNTISITSIGEFVIGMCCAFVVVVSTIIAIILCPPIIGNRILLSYFYVFVMITSAISCYAILGTFQVAFNTLFLCVCQDFSMNNGAEKPYAMTRDMMEYLEASKKLYPKENEETNLPTI